MSRDGRDDAALVAGVLAGDSAAFASIYDRYADRIHDYAFSLLRHSSDAADVMQDTFLTASQRLGQLRDPSRLRPWLYSIARSFVFAVARSRQRTMVSNDIDGVLEMTDVDSSLDAVDLVWAAAAGLDIGDRDVLDLHVRQGLDGHDLADALGVTTNAANVTLHRVRERLEQSVGTVLLFRSSNGECDELDLLMASGLTPLARKRVARHVRSCEVCGERRRRATSASALFSMTGLVAAPAALRSAVLDGARTEPATSAARGLTWRADGFPVSNPSVSPVATTSPRVAPPTDSGPNWMAIVASTVVVAVGLGALFVLFRDAPDQDFATSPGVAVTVRVDSGGASVAPTNSLVRTADRPPASPTNSTTTIPSPSDETSDVTDGPPTSLLPPLPLTIAVVDYQCTGTIMVVVDITGATPLAADLRIVESGATTPFTEDPARPGRFSVTVDVGDVATTPQIVARSASATSPPEPITTELQRCVVID